MKASVLIIEDIPEMANLISLYLQREGIVTQVCGSGEAALELLGQNASGIDLIVLDINLPQMDGYEFLQRFRKTSTLPVIIVSAREADEDIIMGLGFGADDYVIKPFSPRVLTARVRSRLQRERERQTAGVPASDAPVSTVINFGPYSFDPPAYLLKRDGIRMHVSARECEILALLIARAPTPLLPQLIYETIWKQEHGDMTTVAVYIRRLRKKIEPDPDNPTYILTAHGMGYRFQAHA